MKTLSQNEMMEVNGGFTWCHAEGEIALLSCYTGLAVACLVGGLGYLFFC